MWARFEAFERGLGRLRLYGWAWGVIISLVPAPIVAVVWAWLNKLPGVFIALAGIVAAAASLLFVNEVRRFLRHKRSEHPSIKDIHKLNDDWAAFRYEVIHGRSYRRETVELDGKQFINCTFVDCTLRYNGTAPTDLWTNQKSANQQ